MKIILSRKGTDSSSGGMPSPILPCQCLCSIPIPYEPPAVRYSHIRFGKRTLQEICGELNEKWSHEWAHLDPDLRCDALTNRPTNWRPAFGQVAAAASHLVKKRVDAGDLFIFFGWFRKTRMSHGRLAFDCSDRGRHIVFGWLEVGEVVDRLPLRPDQSFLSKHPHVDLFSPNRLNRIYVSSETGLKAGVFATESEGMVLTREGESRRSHWLLPQAFESLRLKCDLTYHRNPERWRRECQGIALQSATRGQEFVFDGDRHPEAKEYLVKKIEAVLSNTPRQCSHRC